VAAAAEPFGHVDQLTVLNGADGLNSMVGGILSQAGTFLPRLSSALKNGQDLAKRPPKTPGA
jgi:flotillin